VRDGSALMMCLCAAHTVGAFLSLGKAAAPLCMGGASSVGGISMIHCRHALRVVDGVVMATQWPRQATIDTTWRWCGRIPLPLGSHAHALHGPHNLTGSEILIPSPTMVQ
jgi:hypothetical protein